MVGLDIAFGQVRSVGFKPFPIGRAGNPIAIALEAVLRI
jgi:hypothetical protein